MAGTVRLKSRGSKRSGFRHRRVTHRGTRSLELCRLATLDRSRGRSRQREVRRRCRRRPGRRPLVFYDGGLGELLGTFVRDGTRATVIDANALKLGVAGSVSTIMPGETEETAEAWYRHFMTVDTSSFPCSHRRPTGSAAIA